jgi:tRNA dimethylallyltransferase
MVAGGAAEEARRAANAGASRTARKALGFDQLLGGDVEGMKGAHRAYARRQLTWMRKMQGVELIDRTGLADEAVADRILALLGKNGTQP